MNELERIEQVSQNLQRTMEQMAAVAERVAMVPQRQAAVSFAPVNLSTDDQPATIYLNRLGKSSRLTMWDALAVVAALLSENQCSPETFPWARVRSQDVNLVRSWLEENRSVATGLRTLSALRGVLRVCYDLEEISADAYMRAIKVKLLGGGGPGQAAGRALAANEIQALLQVCADDPTPAGPRDGAIIGLGIYGGLRRAEIAGLQLEDYNQKGRSLLVHGKGKKQRLIPIAVGLDDVLTEWLAVRFREAKPFFLALNRGARLPTLPMSGAAVYDVMMKRAQAVDVQRFTPHDLRRTFAGNLLDAGADMVTVQKLMGHSDPKTTAGYDRRDERAKREAVDKLPRMWWRK